MKKITLLIITLAILTCIANAQSTALLGMTAFGGAKNGGTIFKINYNGSGFKALYSFTAAKGKNPYGTLVQANNGLFYGTADSGGVNNAGVIFSFDYSNNKYAVVHSFSKTDKNGYYPGGTLLKASNGLLYGMTGWGGANDLGVLFSFNTTNNTYKRLVSFNGANGAHPYHNGLMQSSNGLLYGMTGQGGIGSGGVLFSFNILNNTYNSYDISPTSGLAPNGRPIEATDGYLYATTATSINVCDPVAPREGTLLYFNTTNGVIGQEYVFKGCISGPVGAYLYGSLTEKNAGVFYGLISGVDGAPYPGSIFKFQSSNLTATDLFRFNNPVNSGSFPYGSLSVANDGNLYGMMWAGGVNNLGTIFRFNPSDNSFLKIHDFDGAHGANPYADLIACTAPAQPGNMLGPAALCFGSTITYSIDPVAGATSYKWTVPPLASIVGAANGTSIKVKFGNASGSVTVKAKNACGFSPVRSKSLIVHACTSINSQLSKEFKDVVSPNPTKGPVTLQFNSSKTNNYSLKVVDIVGKAILNIKGQAEPGLNTINFDLSNFAKGIYIIQLREGNNQELVKKIVLQ